MAIDKILKETGMPKLKITDLPFIGMTKNYFPELAVLVAITASFTVWTENWNAQQTVLFTIWFLCIYVYALLASYNARTGYLPNALRDRMLLPLITVFVILGSIWTDYISLWSSVGGLLVLGGIAYSIFMISQARWIGGGAVKLIAVSGLVVGFIGSLIALAVIVFGVLAMNIATKKREVQVGLLIFVAVVASKIITLII